MARSRKSDLIKINYRDLAEMAEFFREWGNRLKSVDDGSTVLNDQPVVETIAEFVRSEIEDALVVGDTGRAHGYGAFMAKRTRVVVVPKGNEIHLRIEGLKESELPESERRSSKDNPDIDLWTLYESGRIGDNIGSNSDRKLVTKDVGGVLTVRHGGKFQKIEGSRAGLMKQIFGQIRAELVARLPDLISADLRSRIFEEAGEAIKVASKATTKNRNEARRRGIKNISRLQNWQRTELTKARRKYQEELSALGYSVAVTSRGQAVARGAGGRFVSHPVTKVVLQKKTN